MADEAQIVELLGYQKGRPIRFKVADAEDIKKGDLMKIQDTLPLGERLAGKSAGASSGTEDKPIGIAAHDKPALDGTETVSIYTYGLFKVRIGASASVTAGNRVVYAAANRINDIGNIADTRYSNLGLALESGESNEWILVFVGGAT